MKTYLVEVTGSQLFYQQIEVEAEDRYEAEKTAKILSTSRYYNQWESIDGIDVTDATIIAIDGEVT